MQEEGSPDERQLTLMDMPEKGEIDLMGAMLSMEEQAQLYDSSPEACIGPGKRAVTAAAWPERGKGRWPAVSEKTVYFEEDWKKRRFAVANLRKQALIFPGLLSIMVMEGKTGGNRQ